MQRERGKTGARERAIVRGPSCLRTGELDHRLGRRVRHIDLQLGESVDSEQGCGAQECGGETKAKWAPGTWSTARGLRHEKRTSRRIEFPSLVMTMPPIGSRSILSIERGPSVVRMMSETALPAAMLLS